MLDFDLRDTAAGQQIFDEGHRDGVKNMVIEALTERFIAIPPEIKESVYSIGNRDMLKELHRHAIRSPHLESFREILSKVSSASKT